MKKEVEIGDVLIYRGGVFTLEKDRPQMITSIDVNGGFFTKFIDNDDLNIINPNSGYFEACDKISKDEHKLNLRNGIPINWHNEEQ